MKSFHWYEVRRSGNISRCNLLKTFQRLARNWTSILKLPLSLSESVTTTSKRINISWRMSGKFNTLGRMFPPQQGNIADKSGNAPAGSVIDTGIAHPVEFDFILQSHTGILGTSRPAHYTVRSSIRQIWPSVIRPYWRSLQVLRDENSFKWDYQSFRIIEQTLRFSDLARTPFKPCPICFAMCMLVLHVLYLFPPRSIVSSQKDEPDLWRIYFLILDHLQMPILSALVQRITTLPEATLICPRRLPRFPMPMINSRLWSKHTSRSTLKCPTRCTSWYVFSDHHDSLQHTELFP